MIGTGYFRVNSLHCRRLREGGEMKPRGGCVQRWRCTWIVRESSGRGCQHQSELETSGFHQLSGEKDRRRNRGQGQPRKHQCTRQGAARGEQSDGGL